MNRVFVCALLFVPAATAASPVVTKVEPPDWWSSQSATTVRILLTGSGLSGARVDSDLATGPVTVSANGTHLFVDLQLPAGVQPGKHNLHVRTQDGACDAPFTVVGALPAKGRFQGFSSDDVIYLIMPDRFANGDPTNDDPPVSAGLHDRARSRYYHGGDFAGIIQHLPYLKDLGVTALWLTPIYDNVNHLNERETYNEGAITDYHGYGAVDYYGVEEHFGTLDRYRELVDKAHVLGIKVIQDQVANHVGPYHPWAKDPPTATWLNGSEADHLANTWRTWTLIDPHATAEMRKSTLDGWFINILPDLNQNDPETARYLIQNTLWWIGRTGIDGIREDTLPYVPRKFWSQWMAAIKRSYPNFRVVGEVFDGDPGLVSFFQGGKPRFDGVDSGVDSLFDFPLQGALTGVFTGAAPMGDLAKVLAHDPLYVDPARLVTFLDLHDLPRFMHAKGATYDGLANALGFVLTVRGIPMLYYGDEIGMPGGGDPDNRRDFPGGWKEDPRNAFEADGRTAEEQKLLAHVQRIAQVRAASDALRRGRMVDLLVEDHAYAFARVAGQARAVIVFNHATQPVTLRVPLNGSGVADGSKLTDALGVGPAAEARNGALEVSLAPHSMAIYR